MKTLLPKGSRSRFAVNKTAGSRAAKLKTALDLGGKNETFSVHNFCHSFGVTQDSFTRLSGFSPRAVAHWSSGKTPRNSAQKHLTELARLFAALSELVDAPVIGQWLKRSNPAFEGSTPLQVIERGETDRVWRLIWELQSGNVG